MRPPMPREEKPVTSTDTKDAWLIEINASTRETKHVKRACITTLTNKKAVKNTKLTTFNITTSRKKPLTLSKITGSRSP
jgi:biotin synthase-related radical SAM superfamily protein